MPSTDDRKVARRFGLEALLILGVIAAWLWLRRHHPRSALGFGAGGVGVGLLALIWPRGALLLRRGWMAVGHAIGAVNGVVLLSVVFFVVLTPISAVRFLLRRTRARGWQPREPLPPDHFDHPY